MFIKDPMGGLPETLRINTGWLMTLGILLFLLGFFAISLSTLTTLVTVMFLGAIILVSGILMLMDTFKFWWGSWLGFTLHLLVGVIYIVVGVLLLKSPLSASLPLTYFLGVFYLIIGAVRLIYVLGIRVPRSNFRIINALVTLLLGVLILVAWPSSSLYVIGLFVGIDLLVAGVGYMMLALSAHDA